MGDHKVPHKREMVLMGKSRWGRGVSWSCPYTNSSPWAVFRSCLLVVGFCHWSWRGTMGIGSSSPSLLDPLALELIYLMPLPSHMVYPPPACVFLLIHLGLLLNVEGSSLLSLSLLILLTVSTSLLALPPTAATNLSSSLEYSLSILLAILSFSTFSMM